MKKFAFAFIGLSFVAGTPAQVTADTSAAPAVELVAARPRTTVRRYRSYSVAPSPSAIQAATPSPAPGRESALGVPTAPPRASQAPSSGRSKPSYMRGDAKARGQFGR